MHFTHLNPQFTIFGYINVFAFYNYDFDMLYLLQYIWYMERIGYELYKLCFELIFYAYYAQFKKNKIQC